MQPKSLLPQVTLPLAAAILATSAWSSPATGQSTFSTPKEAGRALLSAAEAGDVRALMNIFGPEGDEILKSGDAVKDNSDRAMFVAKAKRSLRERINPAKPTRAILLVGADDFPFPVPLVKSGNRWYFDTAAGKREILARRIGSDEMDAIAACKAYVDAQYDYAAEDRNKNGVPEYARKLISSPGIRDGLFWPGSDVPPTEFSATVKEAGSEGYKKSGEVPTPYHGYYFRILTAQGPKARGGALDYVQHSLMIGGFGLMASPVTYGVSGVKTFIVNQDGIIYEKDLGPSTNTAVEALTTFDPDRTWRRVR